MQGWALACSGPWGAQPGCLRASGLPGTVQEVARVFPPLTHCLRPWSFQSSLPVPPLGPGRILSFPGSFQAIKRPVRGNLKLPSQIQFHAHLVPSCRAAWPCPGSRREGGATCRLLPLPPSRLGLGWGRETPNQVCLSHTLILCLPPRPDSRFLLCLPCGLLLVWLGGVDFWSPLQPGEDAGEQHVPGPGLAGAGGRRLAGAPWAGLRGRGFGAVSR